jgi:hypothetical protein
MNNHTIRARNLRLGRAAADVLAAMRDGQTLRFEFCRTGARWFLSGGRSVDDRAARLVIINPEIVGEADSLFPGLATSQTYHVKWSPSDDNRQEESATR